MNRHGSTRLRWMLTAALTVLSVLATSCATNTGGGSTLWLGTDCGTSPVIAPGASLFGCNLTGLDLTGANLSGADLRGALLSNANLTGADLTNANLEGANLTGANLTNANLTGANLAGAILIGALFIGAILSGVSFDFGHAYGADGNGGGAPSGGSCVGTYCAGYNQATVDNGHPLCDPDVGAGGFGDWFFVHRTQSQLQAAGTRSVVLDGATSFKGAVFDYSNQDLPSIIQLRGISWSTADFSDATFVNAGFGCQQGTGARFSGATFTSTGIAENALHWYVVSFTDSDFSDSTWTGAVMSTIDFTGSSFAGAHISNWQTENQVDFNSDGAPDDGWVTPLYLMRLDDTDFTGARVGMDVNPGTGSAHVKLSDNFNNMGFTTVSLANANLSGAELGSLEVVGADLSGVTATGTTLHGPGFFGGANFTGGWAGANWASGAEWYDFSGATCPDGNPYSQATPCLP